MKKVLGTLLTATLLSVTGTAMAATYNVPADFATIQSAIDASVAGDEVVVAPGTYHEHLVISDRSLTLRSSGGAAQTIIDGDAAGTVVGISAPTDVPAARTATLDGFTIQNGTKGISVSGNYDVNLNNSVVTNNIGGGGVYLYTKRPSGDYINFVANNSIISNNQTATFGGGISASYHSFPTLNNCSLLNNTASYGGGAIFMDQYGHTELNNTFVTGNTANQYGGGVYGGTYSNVVAVNTVFANNTGSQGGAAIYLTDGASANALNSTFVNNRFWNGYNSIKTATGTMFGAGKFYATNTIVWALEYGKIDIQDFIDPAKVFIDHSIIQQMDGAAPYPGTGNINQAPSFVNATNGDYRLNFNSVGINQGVPLTGSWENVKSDIVGTVRPSGTAFDIGAYEFNDNNAPVTTATGINPNYVFGDWFLDGALFVINASDDTALKEIHYAIDGVETVIPISTAYANKTYTAYSNGLTAAGRHTLTYYSIDALGNAETVKTYNFGIAARPTTSRVITGATLYPSQYYVSTSSNVTISITAQDVYPLKEIHYIVNGVETVVPGNTATINLTTDGNYTIKYFAVSTTGIPSASQEEFYTGVIIDRTAPAISSTITGTAGAGGGYTSDVTVTITATDANTFAINYTLDGLTTRVNSPAIVTITTEGVHTLSYSADDMFGNTSPTTNQTINIDKTAPFVAATTPVDSATGVRTSSSITITLNENVTKGSAFNNILLKKGSTTVTTTKTLTGNTLTIKPSSAMSKNSTYTLTMPAGSFVDGVGLNSAASQLTFTTGSR